MQCNLFWSEASYSFSIMYVSVWENAAKNNDSIKIHPYNLIEKSSLWYFRNVTDTIYKYNSQEIVFFPLSLEYKSAVEKSQFVSQFL